MSRSAKDRLHFLPKTEDDLYHINKVFTLKISNPYAFLPQDFANLLPKVDISLFKKEKITESDLINGLALTLDQREPIIRWVNNIFDKILNIETISETIFATILQSFTCLYFQEIQRLPNEILEKFVESLIIAQRIYPNGSDLTFRTFYFFYIRISTSHMAKQCLRIVDNFFDSFPKSPSYFIPIHIEYIFTLLSFTSDSKDEKIDAALIKHTERVLKILEDTEINSGDIKKDFIELFFVSVYQKCLDGGLGNITKFKSLLMLTALEIARITDTRFTQLRDIVNEVVSCRDFESSPTVDDEDVYESKGTHADVSGKNAQEYINTLPKSMIPLIYFFSKVPTQSTNTAFRSVFNTTKGANTLPLVEFALIVLSMPTFRRGELNSCLKKMDYPQLFLYPKLFTSNYSIFQKNQSNVTNLRLFSIESYKTLYNKLTNDITVASFIPIMISVKSKVYLFAELIYISRNILDFTSMDPDIMKEIFMCFHDVMVTMQGSKAPYIEESKETFFYTIREFAKKPAFSKAFIESKEMIDETIKIFKASDENKEVALFMSAIFSFSVAHYDLIDISYMYQAISNLMDTISTEKERGLHIGKTLLTSIHSSLLFASEGYILYFYKSPLFSSLKEYIQSITTIEKTPYTESNISPVLVTSLLILFYFNFAVMKKLIIINWSPYAEVIRKFGVTKEIYCVILNILSLNQVTFSGINCIEAAPLIVPILESEFRMQFLSDLLNIVNRSIVQCVNCVRSEIHTYLLDLITRDIKDLEQFLILTILMRITSAMFDRESLFRCIMLTDPSRKTNKYIGTILTFLTQALNEDEGNTKNFLQFAAQLGSIVLPNIALKDFLGNVIVSANILLADFNSSADTVDFISFSSANCHLAFILSIDKLTVRSNVFPECKEVNIKFPVNKWFNIIIAFDKLSNFAVYIDGNKEGTFQTSCNVWNEPLEKIIMLQPIQSTKKTQNSTVTGEVSSIHVLLSPVTDKIISVLSDLRAGYNELLSLPKLAMLYSAEFSERNTLINVADNSYGNATFTMYSFKNVCSIKEVFIGAKGIYFIISQFSKIDYESSDSEKQVNELLSAVSEFLICSEEVQTQMLACHGFSTIAFHIKKMKVKYLTKKFKSVLRRIEKSITDEKLLSSFYQHMLLEFPNWFELDEKSICDTLKHWNNIAKKLPEMFNEEISLGSIVERCYKLIETNKFGADVSNEILPLMLTAAQNNCTMDAIGILIRLLQYTKDNDDFALRMLYMLKTLADEVPSMASKIQELVIESKALICSDNPLIFITMVELFAVTELLYIECIVYLLGECYDTKNPTKMSEYAVVLCQELVSGSGKETLDELITKKSYRGVSTGLIPFICIISFYCLPETVPKICKFLTSVFSNQRCIKIIASSIKPIGLFFSLIFTMVIYPDFLMSLVGIFSVNTQLLADAFALIDTISLYSDRDGHTMQNALASALALIVTERKNPEEISRFVDIISTFLCYGSDRSVFSRHDQQEMDKTFNLFQFIEIFRANPVTKKPLRPGIYIEGTEWDDINIAILLVYMLPDCKSHENVRRIIILMYFILTADSAYTAQIIPQIEQLASRTDVTAQDLSPLFLVMSKRPDDFKNATNFMLKYETFVVSSTDTFQQATNCFTSFAESLCPQSNVEKHLRKLFDASFTYQKIIPYPFERITNYLRRGLNSKTGNSERKWRQLFEMMEEDHTPLFNQESHNLEYIRGNRFDKHFRPILFKKIKKGSKDGKEVKHATKEDLISFTKYDKKGLTFVGSCPMELWSAKCQKISNSKVADGMMYVCPTRLVFVGEKRSKVIKGENISSVFWRWTLHKPDSIALFTTTFRGYIFRFPGQKSHDFTQEIKKVEMPNCVFFQEYIPEIEIERLQLTQKWKSHQMSNFDYLTWLNIFSGRSYIDIHSYPIYPWLLTDPKSAEPNRDLRHNIGIRNKNLFKIRRQMQEEAFDPTDIELFDHTFSSAPEVVRFNLRIQPFGKLYTILGEKERFDSYEEELKNITDGEKPTITELTPEFFFSPEVFTESNGIPSVKLPSYVGSAEEFVYRNRRALESEEVSKLLPVWIDHVWGVKQRGCGAATALNSVDFRLFDTVWEMPERGTDKEIQELLIEKGEVPHMLFTGPHQKRKPIPMQKNTTPTSTIIPNLDGSILAMKVTGASYDKLRIYALLDNYKYMCIRITSSNFEIEMPQLPKLLHPCSPDTKVAFLGEDSTSFAFVNNNTIFPHFFNHDIHCFVEESITPHIKEITCLTSYGKTIISGGAAGEVAQWSINEESQELVAYSLQHNDRVVCIATSLSLGIVVSVSISGLLVITTIPNLKFLREKQLNIKEDMVPFKVVIAEEMGYIIVFLNKSGKTVIQSYTINTGFIKEATIPVSITDAIGFTNQCYLDILAVLTSTKHLLLLDAFTMEVKKTFRYHYDLSKIEYNQETGTIVIATRDNVAIVVPSFIM